MLLPLITLQAFFCTFILLQASRHFYGRAMDFHADVQEDRMRNIVDWKQAPKRPTRPAKRRSFF